MLYLDDAIDACHLISLCHLSSSPPNVARPRASDSFNCSKLDTGLVDKLVDVSNDEFEAFALDFTLSDRGQKYKRITNMRFWFLHRIEQLENESSKQANFA
jgi:hypothetical protein